MEFKYNLRKVFENAIFVQGKGNNISIVDKNGKIYESLTSSANTQIDNAKKIIASSGAKYVIKADGTLWVKGNPATGMWGEYVGRSEYVQVTKDGTNQFNNVKDVYTSKIGSSAIFITEDNKMYWAGSNAYIILPNIKGDYNTGGNGVVTNYPKEVTSPVIEEIREKISNIAYSRISGQINGENTFYEVGGIYPTPVRIEGLPNNIRYMSLGNGFAIFASKSGEVYGIGKNDYGQLGTGDSIGRTEFVRCTMLEE